MSDDDIRTALADIVNEVTGIPVSAVEYDKQFAADLDIDSLSMVEVIVAAEERFGVRIPDDDAQKLKTVRDAVEYIKRAGVAA